MIGVAVSAESREHRLDVASAVADALLERSTLATNADRGRRVNEALTLLEDSVVPTAVFDVASRRPRSANTAWRALFGSNERIEIPGLRDTARVESSRHFGELALEQDGRPMYCAATVRASHDEAGATSSIIVVCLDITDEVMARELAVDADALVWSGRAGCDADYFNRRWESTTHRAKWQNAIHPHDLAKCTESLAWATREGGSTELQARLRRDGTPHYRWHRVRFAAAAGARWLGAAIDIHDLRNATTERNELLELERTARAEAETANRLKDQFIATVSHELRTPLTTMVLWEAILRDEGTEPPLRAKALDAIRQSVLVQSRVVGDLLDISRSISGKLFVDLRPLDIERVVHDALEAIAPLALAKGIVIERRGTEDGGVASADATRLRQVFDNVLTNALSATQPGGRIVVTVSHPGQTIVISVEDTGRGISTESLRQLFEPFRQIEDPTTREAGGLGLGLAISRRLVELHRGTLVAASHGLGRGATLTVTLPAIAMRAADGPVGGVPNLERMRVLVIDDDQRVREALTLLLRGAGADVETADSAEAGRGEIAQRAPEVLVCDIAMPGEDGYSFIRGVRASGNEVAAIALSAHATDADVERALAAGFDRHLAKPIEFEHLAVSIDELVAARRAHA